MVKIPLSTGPYSPPDDKPVIRPGLTSYIELPSAIVSMHKSQDGVFATLADGRTVMLNDGTFNARH